MYAPAGTLFRQAIADTGSSGSTSPGRPDRIALHASMRLADWWPDPDTSTRAVSASPANRDALHRYAFAPFGGGVHKCIGQHFAGMTVQTSSTGCCDGSSGPSIRPIPRP